MDEEVRAEYTNRYVTGAIYLHKFADLLFPYRVSAAFACLRVK